MRGAARHGGRGLAVALVGALLAVVGDFEPSAHAAGARGAATETIYLLSGERFAPVKRAVDVPSGEDALEATIDALLEGPTRAELDRRLDTAIPTGSRLLRSSQSGGTAVLTFDRTFSAPGSSLRTQQQVRQDYRGRLAQVTFTATALDGIESVRISAPGKRTFTLTRADFQSTGTPPQATNGAVGGVSPSDPRSVQQALVRLTYLPPEAVTGTYDYRTQQAVLAFQGWEGLGRDGVVGPQTAGRLATATAPKPRDSAPGRRAELSEEKGVVLLVQDNVVVRTIHTSTGKSGFTGELGTPSGTFEVTRKERRSWSVPFQVWLPDAVYFNGGIAFHGYPDVPAYPASHGCARLPLVEAPVVFAFLATGDRVTVY